MAGPKNQSSPLGALANIQDSLDDEISMYGADRATLEGKLAALSTAQQFALVEAIEAFWDGVSVQELEA